MPKMPKMNRGGERVGGASRARGPAFRGPLAKAERTGIHGSWSGCAETSPSFDRQRVSASNTADFLGAMEAIRMREGN